MPDQPIEGGLTRTDVQPQDTTPREDPAPPHTVDRKRVGLALQGGGSWGAYTWGALDAVLASRSVDVAQLSGTSAGAINAAIVAGALATGTPADARRRLRSFWLTVAKPPAADVGRRMWGPIERAWRDTIDGWLVAGSALSPYSANPLGINPLRAAIAAHVDVDAIRSRAAPALFVTVTHVRTGLPRVIANDAITVDVLLASAALPQLFQAVEIDGEPYWDGGYSGNPTLWPMIHSGLAQDLVVVQLVPDVAPDVPKAPAAIRRRVGEIVFNSSLVAEMQAIAAMRALTPRDGGAAVLHDVRLHRVGPPSRALLADGSSMERSHAWIERLHRAGRTAARNFLGRHGADLGVRETLEVARVYTGPHKPRMRLPANEAAFDALPAPRSAALG